MVVILDQTPSAASWASSSPFLSDLLFPILQASSEMQNMQRVSFAVIPRARAHKVLDFQKTQSGTSSRMNGLLTATPQPLPGNISKQQPARPALRVLGAVNISPSAGPAEGRSIPFHFSSASGFRPLSQTLVDVVVGRSIFRLLAYKRFLKLLWKSLLVIPIFSLKLNQFDGFKAERGGEKKRGLF